MYNHLSGLFILEAVSWTWNGRERVQKNTGHRTKQRPKAAATMPLFQRIFPLPVDKKKVWRLGRRPWWTFYCFGDVFCVPLLVCHSFHVFFPGYCLVCPLQTTNANKRKGNSHCQFLLFWHVWERPTLIKFGNAFVAHCCHLELRLLFVVKSILVWTTSQNIQFWKAPGKYHG